MSDEAASAALGQLEQQIDAAYVARMRRYIPVAVRSVLGARAASVVVTISVDDDHIGLAVGSSRGETVAVSGLLADCVADPRQWVADRCAEIAAATPGATMATRRMS
jgi:hypothetical protein